MAMSQTYIPTVTFGIYLNAEYAMRRIKTPQLFKYPSAQNSPMDAYNIDGLLMPTVLSTLSPIEYRTVSTLSTSTFPV